MLCRQLQNAQEETVSVHHVHSDEARLHHPPKVRFRSTTACPPPPPSQDRGGPHREEGKPGFFWRISTAESFSEGEVVESLENVQEVFVGYPSCSDRMMWGPQKAIRSFVAFFFKREIINLPQMCSRNVCPQSSIFVLQYLRFCDISNLEFSSFCTFSKYFILVLNFSYFIISLGVCET